MKTAKIWFAITTTTAIVLIVVGFIIPPMGTIDGSVLTATGELMGFAAIAQVPALVKRGTDVTLQHGNTSITVNSPDKPTTDDAD
jgi:hypothetical protein